jgi:hypothetical protein
MAGLYLHPSADAPRIVSEGSLKGALLIAHHRGIMTQAVSLWLCRHTATATAALMGFQAYGGVMILHLAVLNGIILPDSFNGHHGVYDFIH